MTTPHDETALDLVRNLIWQGTPIADAWRAIAHHLAEVAGSELLPELLAHDVNGENLRLEKWLLDVLRIDPPSRQIQGLRFGLYHPDLNGRSGCDFYLAGTESFDDQNDAWIYDQSYRASMTPCSRILGALSVLSEEGLARNNAALIHICLWFGLLAVAELCRRHSGPIRGTARRRGVGVGFDGGDVIIVGMHSATGFVPSPPGGMKRPRTRPRLPRGDYFRLEAGNDAILCTCADNSLSRELFGRYGTLETVSLTATINSEWSGQTGTYGSLSPFFAGFIRASVAAQLESAFPNEVRFHPLEIVGNPEQWRVMQALRFLKGYDRQETTRQRRLVLFRSAVSGHNIFFVDGYYEGLAVFVSRSVATMLNELGVTGVTFIPVWTSEVEAE